MAGNRLVPDTSTATTASTDVMCIVPTIHLTFDDGPSPNSGTEVVLDMLRARSLKATFFVNMKNAANDRARQLKLLQRMVSEGHTIGTHGYEHAKEANAKYYSKVAASEIRQDFEKNENELEKLYLVGHDKCPTMEVARLQGDGRFQGQFVAMITKELGMAHAGWNIEFYPNGTFARGKRNWEEIDGVTADMSRPIRDHDIVLLHDKHWAGKEDRLEALMTFLTSRYIVKPLTPKFDKACGAVRQPGGGGL